MEDNKIYRKMFTINGDYPFSGVENLITNNGIRDYDIGSFWLTIPIDHDTLKSATIDKDVKWWMKEVKIPTDIDILIESVNVNCETSFIQGAKYVIGKLLNKN